MKTLEATIPDQLNDELATLVDEGWFESHDQIVSEALRRFVDAHRPRLMEQFVHEDVQWGLHGKT